MSLEESIAELQKFVTEYKRLRQFEEQMLLQQPFQVGNRVALTDEVASINYEESHGWRGSEHILQPGNTGTIKDVRWNEFCLGGEGAWQVAWEPDLEWTHARPIDGRRIAFIRYQAHVYYMPYSYVEYTEYHRPILPPSNLDEYDIVHMPVYDDEGEFRGNYGSKRDVPFKEVVRFAKQRGQNYASL